MKYKVNTPISAGKGKRYEVDEEIELNDKQAAELVACGAVTPVATGPAAGSTNPGPSGSSQRPNVQESIKLVAIAETAEALDALAKGEERKTVLEAIAKRREALTQPLAEPTKN